MKTVIAVLGFVALIFLNHVEGRSMGAPDSACTNVSPDPTAHLGPAQSGASPFTLTVDGSPSVYIPDQEYNLTFSSNANFGGFLVIGRDMNGANVGTFTAAAGQQRACSDMRGITHSNANAKTSVTLAWTAPTNGTGPVQFRFAGVQVRATYWANQLGPLLQESGNMSGGSAPSAKVAGILSIASLVAVGLVAMMM
jgi:hypothetical protein